MYICLVMYVGVLCTNVTSKLSINEKKRVDVKKITKKGNIIVNSFVVEEM